MDKLAEKLRSDAKAIDVEVSDELDRRIRASLRASQAESDKPARPQQRPAGFWWASSLTGIAAAMVVIAVINSHSQPEEKPQTTAAITPEIAPTPVPATPSVDWNTESAMLTQPLQQELEDLQSDLKKAEELLKKDIGF